MLKKFYIFIVLLSLLTFKTAYTNTDGTELRLADQPEKLVLQLGEEWIGTKFELKTDAGVYPAFVVVDNSGILTMELGGSKVYTLSCLGAGNIKSEPEQTIGEPISKPKEINPTGKTKPLLIYLGILLLVAVLWFILHKKKTRIYKDE